MATSIEILNNIRDTIGNLVDKYKEQSTANETTKDELKEIDKELGDCLNLLMSIDTSLTSLNFDDSKSLILDLENKQEKIDLLLNLETTINEMITKYDNGLFKGEQGKPFTYDMFTEAQLALLKVKGDSFTIDDFTSEEFESLRGATGKSLTFDMLTLEQKEELRGATGKSLTFDMLTLEQKEEVRGATGKPFTYDMFTEAQLALLKVKGDSFTIDDFTNEEFESLRGATGKSLTFDMLTLEQKEELRGATGSQAKSNYDIYLETGASGTKEDFINSLKSSVSDTGWKDLKPYLVNGWVEYAISLPILYRKIGDIVYFQGLVKLGSNSYIFADLPSEISPKYTLYIQALPLSSGGSSGLVCISSDGNLSVNNYSSVWTSLSFSYLVK